MKLHCLRNLVPVFGLLANLLISCGPAISADEVISSLELHPPTASLSVGDELQFVVMDQDGNNLRPPTEIQWSTSNPEVLVIDGAGLARGVGIGGVEVTASLAGQTASASVIVADGILVGLRVSPATGIVSRGGMLQFEAFGDYAGGSSQRLTDAVQWHSDSPSTASVTQGGQVQGLSVGTAQIRASFAETTSNPSNLRVIDKVGSALALGSYHTCVLLEGNVRCWGRAESGQLGYGTSSNLGDDEAPSTSGAVPIGEDAVSIAAGDEHSCVLTNSGGVRCWGMNGLSGRLGYASSANIGASQTPESSGDVILGGRASAVTAGGCHTCALLESGAIRCWGCGGGGRLGYANQDNIGDNEHPADAGDVDLGAPATQVVAGFQHTCALLQGGTVRCWGLGSFGRLGHGSPSALGDNETPAALADIDIGGTVIQLAAGWRHTCALLATGAVRCWGFGAFGQLGYGDSENIGDNETPASAGDVPLGAPAVAIATGEAHSCALLTDGQVSCWGDNFFGQLGYAHTELIGDDETPIDAGFVELGGPAKHIATGDLHTCAQLQDDTFRCWGNGIFGRLGYGNESAVGDDESPRSVGPVPL